MKKLILLFAAIMMASIGLKAQTQKVSYLYPVYNTDGVATSGIKEWKTGEVEASVITSSEDAVTWSAGWYVVNSEVTLAKGAICNGAVNLILADGAKLTTTGISDDDQNIFTSAINVFGEGNSLTIYGQANQIGELTATGGDFSAGIGGGERRSGSNITINGGTVTATGFFHGAGIGGGQGGAGSNIIINGGTVTATGGVYGAGIGGGYQGSGSNITINGGTVTATGDYGAGIGSGNIGGKSSNIFVADGVNVVANGYVITHTSSGDIAENLDGNGRVIAFDLAPFIKAIEDAVGGSEDETIIGIANTANERIHEQATADKAKGVSDLAVTKINAIKEILTLIGADPNVRNTEFISKIITDIASATDKGFINTKKTQAVNEIPLFLKGFSSAFGTMGEKRNGPAVIVTDQDDKQIILYSPKKVQYIKVSDK